MKSTFFRVTILILFGAVGAWLKLHGGQPSSCPVPGHQGPICKMQTCASFDKDGNVTGAKCTKDCAETCCGCPGGKCNRHHETPSEDEGRPQ